MEEVHGVDLTYVTERIITVLFPRGLLEQAYLENLQHITQMLQSKHGHNYLVINLSEKTDDLTQINQKVLDTGWVEHLAPSLGQIYSVCTTAENWLHTHPQHVLVLHCRGRRGPIGVLVASYIHFTSTLASADQTLDHFSMRRFYNDQVSALMTPSQKRYVLMFGSLLKGALKMSPSPSFLLCAILHGLPRMCPLGVCCIFLRVYQNLQAVCTSAVYHVQADQTDKVYFVLQPAQLLKGDIMVVCYHKNSQSTSRQVVFRLQFHTGIIHGHTLHFSKGDLDSANQDPRFPEDGTVELVFSESPEKLAGKEQWQNNATVTLDYNTLDPLVRRDSYRQMAVPHQLGPLDGSLYAQVRKRSSEEGTSPTSPDPGDPTLSASDDSGLSLSTQWTAAAASRSSGREWGQDQRVRARRLLSGLALELMQPPLEVTTELFVPSAGVEGGMTGEKAGVGQLVNGQDSSCERETDILDDNEEEDPEEASPSLHRPSSSIGCLYSESLPDALGLVHDGGYSTHTWVQQQQVVDGHLITCQPVDGEERTGLETMPLLAAPHTPPRGKSSREAMERVVGGEEGSDVTHTTHSTHTPPVSEAACREDELESLATDIDESIEQLNLLILDLDPTFVPVPTRSGPSSRSASFHTNGLRHVGPARLPGWQHHQASDVTDFSDLHSPGWRGGGTSSYRNSPTYSPSQASSQFGHLYPMDSVDSGRTTPLTDSSYIVPPTPAFPVSPPTPYMKNVPEFSQLSSGGLWEGHRTLQDSRSFLDSLSHSGGSADTDPFRAQVSVPPASYQRSFGSTRSMSSGSPLPHIDSSSPPPVWQARSFQPQPSPPLSLSSPDAHSSPRRAPRCLESRAGWREAEEAQSFSLLQGNGGLEHSLLEAMEGLEGLGLGLGLSLGEGVLPPVLPDKRRGVGAELGSRSPSLSGYSSPHSGSSLSIPFPSSMSPEPHRGLSGTPSPGADSFGGKHDTVKFVQDTSKFWYKPEISRDQAIAVLKDREPGFFIVRDSHSFRGAYGLAMKVDTPPPSVVQQNKKVGDLSSELVRHFLIECTSKGVRLKGCPNEPYFGSLTALVCQHSITPLALPCRLILPDRDPLEELSNSTPQTATNSAAELLKQGAACNVWYLGSVELESLTGHQAVQKAAGLTLAMDPPPTSTVVHFKVSAQGITLTDNQRKLFFRRHYTVNTVIFCSLDPQDRKWTRDGCSTAKIFGFVARKSQSGTENVCHLFAEHDPEQPASAIVNFVSKVMIGSHRSK